jgi:cytochrome P450
MAIFSPKAQSYCPTFGKMVYLVYIMQLNIHRFMMRDPRNYRRPEIFDPERFLGPEPELDPRTCIFGFGRRACPGRLLADQNMFITFATTLAVLNISKAIDAHGQEIEAALEYHGEYLT